MESLYGEEKTLIMGRGTHATKESPPPFVAMFAEVEVDIEMGIVRPIHVVTAIDVGKALNPAICEGQVEGAVTQSLGYALTEEIVISPEGQSAESQLHGLQDLLCGRHAQAHDDPGRRPRADRALRSQERGRSGHQWTGARYRQCRLRRDWNPAAQPSHDT